MIVDFRIYCTLYALVAVAWLGAFPLIARAKPGHPTFRQHMDFANRYMLAVVFALVLIGLVNFVDWLWS